MKAMIPLRIMVFIVYGSFVGVYPMLVLHAILLPLNAYRLREMVRLVREIRDAAHGKLVIDWLKPFMSKRTCAKGDILFRRDDAADEMFFTLAGKFRLRELGMDIG